MAKNAESNVTDNHGNTPLHYVAIGGWEVPASLLVRKGTNVNALNKNGKSPLHLAVENDNDGVATILTTNGG